VKPLIDAMVVFGEIERSEAEKESRTQLLLLKYYQKVQKAMIGVINFITTGKFQA